jgi:hypothetical protein
VIGVFDELPAFWNNFTAYNQGDGRQLALTAYGGRAGMFDRVKLDESLIAERCALSVLGGVQTDVLRRVIERDADDGFWARFLYVFPSTETRARIARPLPIEPARAALLKLRSLAFTRANQGCCISPRIAGKPSTTSM